MPSKHVQLGGLLGTAVTANHHGRLSTFIVDETSQAIALFGPEPRRQNQEGDWYGEHAGKWLMAAAKSARLAKDAALTSRVSRVADFLVQVQEPDGYLGTYATERRFMQRQAPGPRTWDGAPGQRTWDIWTHSYLVLGLLEAHRCVGKVAYLTAASRIGDLVERTLQGGIDITTLGNHFGMSATVFIDAAMELYFQTNEPRYLHLAQTILQQADARPELALLSKALAGADASDIGTGKAYQLLWNVNGIAKLYRATGDKKYLTAAQNVWANVREHHLTLGGGPWGGVAHRSREVFNPGNVFSPEGYVETCSVLAWMQLNAELYRSTDEIRFAEEIEKAAYNDLLGAAAPNGEDWCYYSFPNGQRIHTTHWRCCKSSGALALAELPENAYHAEEDQLTVLLYGPSELSTQLRSSGKVTLRQETHYPFEGTIRLTLQLEQSANFTLRLRIPSWAKGARVKRGAEAERSAEAGSFVDLHKTWAHGDTVTLFFPMPIAQHRAVNRNVQESRAPDGTPVRQEVLRREFVALSRGPLVYATGLIEGFKLQETLRAPSRWELTLAEPSMLSLNIDQRAPLLFRPYFEAGGREHGTWRLTWMNVEPTDA